MTEDEIKAVADAVLAWDWKHEERMLECDAVEIAKAAIAALDKHREDARLASIAEAKKAFDALLASGWLANRP